MTNITFTRVLIATNDEFLFYISQEILPYIFCCTKILDYEFRIKNKNETSYKIFVGMAIYNKLHFRKENSHRFDDKIRIYQQKDSAN